MYKWAFDSKMKEINDTVVYAEKSGWYCDLCGELILEDDEDNSLHYRSKYYIRPRKYMDFYTKGSYSLTTSIPVLKIYSIMGDAEIDMCSDCEYKIMDAITTHSPSIIKRLTTTSLDEIRFHHEAVEQDRLELNRLRNERDNLQNALDTIGRYD